jgi:hypothetical protein
MPQLSGREREAKLVRRANRASAVGQLMLGEVNNWQKFLEADVIALEALSRRRLQSGVADVKARLSPEIRSFCSKNFRGMDERKLSLLYEDIKAYRGLEIPLIEFEKRYAPIRREVLRGNPAHLTVSISLWGLQFKFPEDELAKDLAFALRLTSEAENEINQQREKPHLQLKASQEKISSLVRQKAFAARSSVLCCFNLMEAYLNGLAWDYIQFHDTTNLSNRQKKLLEDTTSVSISDKLKKYPELLTSKGLWREPDQELEGFIEILKPFRDSLVHPSPFSAPERFGGYDKLRLFYRVDHDTALLAANLLTILVRRIHEHIYSDLQTLPNWISDLESAVTQLTPNWKEK